MRSLNKIIPALFAVFIMIATSARAQVQTSTYQVSTIGQWSGSIATFSSKPIGQTFSGITKINALEYVFVTALPKATLDLLMSTSTVTATFGEWNSSTSSFTDLSSARTFSLTVSSANFVNSSSVSSLSNFTVNTTDGVFNGSTNTLSDLSLDPTKTYALILKTTNSLYDGLWGLAAMGSNTYSYGSAYTGDGLLGSQADYAFSLLSVEVPVAVPESSTVASILGCAMAAGLVGFRARRNRKLNAEKAAAA